MSYTVLRRDFLKAGTCSAVSIFGLSGLPNALLNKEPPLHANFPSQDIASVREMVLVAHGDLTRVKEMVTERPELAKASYDWGFGDWESALGAANHMGRTDIARVLIESGARPNIFTFAILGELEVVKTMVLAYPGIQTVHGPHGITLLRHAKIRMSQADLSEEDKTKVGRVVNYLESIEGSDKPSTSLNITEKEQKIYMGDYSFGESEDEIFHVKLNRRGMLHISKGSEFGRVLNRVEEHAFAPGGAPNVRVHFQVIDQKATHLTIHDPVPLVKALRIYHGKI